MFAIPRRLFPNDAEQLAVVGTFPRLFVSIPSYTLEDMNDPTEWEVSWEADPTSDAEEILLRALELFLPDIPALALDDARAMADKQDVF